MKITFQAATVLLATHLLFGLAQASEGETTSQGATSSPSVIEKTGNAIERGAHAVVRGVKRGANATARGIEHGAQATGRAAHKVSKKIGISSSDTKAEDSKP